MELDDLSKLPHRRFNPLNREWVLVSPHRTQRPWQGQVEESAAPQASTYDPDCYLCPGNERAGGLRNPKYSSTFVFTNDFAALRPDVPRARIDEGSRGLLVSESEAGTCRVVCFSPRHDLTLPRMSLGRLRRSSTSGRASMPSLDRCLTSIMSRYLKIVARPWGAVIRIRMDRSGLASPSPMSLAKNRIRSWIT